MGYKKIIFDLDGTLLDTSGGVMASVKYTLNQIGVSDFDDEMLLSFIGPPIQKSLKEHFLLDEQEIIRASKIFRDYYKSVELYNAKVYSGIIELLGTIKKNGGRIGVATFKRQDYAVDILEHFKIASFCDYIYGADDKGILTKRDIVEKCLVSFNTTDRGDCVLIGDSYFDAMGAEAAEIDFIAVTYGFGFRCKNDVAYNNVGVANNACEIYNLVNKKEIHNEL